MDVLIGIGLVVLVAIGWFAHHYLARATPRTAQPTPPQPQPSPQPQVVGAGTTGTIRGKSKWRWFWWLVSIVVLIAVGLYGYGKYEEYDRRSQAAARASWRAAIDRGEYPCPFRQEWTIDKNWSPNFQSHPSCRFIVKPGDPGIGYEVNATISGGRRIVKQYPPFRSDGTRPSRYLPDNVASFSLRIMQTEKASLLPVTIVIYR